MVSAYLGKFRFGNVVFNEIAHSHLFNMFR
jgi:hypothetical protein